MLQLILKTAITVGVILGVSELGKRFSAAAAILAALPLTSILAMIWLYVDTRDTARISQLSTGIFWMVLPTLLFFIILPLLLKWNIPFGWAMAISSAAMVAFYWLYVAVLRGFGITF